MANWFAGINQAASGINAASYGLSVVSQNISNADTDGYTRETTVQGSVEVGSTGIWSRTTQNSLLGGVTVLATQRSDDPVIDARLRSETAKGASADTTASVMTNVESLFPEPSDNGLSSQLSDFWSAWGDVANDPGGTTSSTSARTDLLQQASGLVTTLNSLSSSLSDVVTSTSSTLTNDLTSANTAASQLATLNAQIRIATGSGQAANSLLDQRDQLLTTLSKTVGGVATINSDGTADVTVGGTSLVSGTTAGTLSADSSYQVSINGSSVSVSSGSVGAEVTALTTTLPQYQAQLDAVANALSSTVNSIQTNGYDENGNAGTAMFTGSGAAGITLAITDPTGIAAAATSGGTLDGSNALSASQQGTATNGPDALYTALVGAVASASQSASQASALQDSVVSNVSSLQSSVSGVNYDEEVSNMLTYQRAFQASSRVLTTMDDMLDTLINHTGHVGIA